MVVDPIITITDTYVKTGKGLDNTYVSLTAVEDVWQVSSDTMSAITDSVMDDMVTFTDFTNLYKVTQINHDVVTDPVVVGVHDLKGILKDYDVDPNTVKKIVDDLKEATDLSLIKSGI